MQARALEACHRAGVEVVIMSGRRRVQVHEDARLIGQNSFIFEAGSAFSIEGETFMATGDFAHADGVTLVEQVSARGVPDLLLGHFGDKLEYHEPWHLDREMSHLFRGEVDTAEANRLLEESGNGDLRLLDNGAIRRAMPGNRGHPRLPPGRQRGLQGLGCGCPLEGPGLRARADNRGR